jgi:DNA repair protein RadC
MQFTFKSDDEVVARAQQIVASRINFKLETGKPFKLNDDQDKTIEELKTYLALNMAHFDLEHLHALYFDGGGKLIKGVEVGVGTNGAVAVNNKEIVRQGLLLNADLVVVAHNHPNQDPVPSPEDISAMASVSKALHMFDMNLLFAFVVAGPTPDKVIAVPPPPARTSRDALLALLGGGIQ